MRTFCALLVIASLSIAVAQDSGQAFVIRGVKDYLKKIPEPPKSGSLMDQADVEATVAIQKDATEDEILRANVASLYFGPFLFSEVLGPRFNRERAPQTGALFDAVERSIKNLLIDLKTHFVRARPCAAHPDLIQDLIKIDSNFCYPSSYAARAWLYALILSELEPHKRESFLRYAIKIGHYRVLGGCAYPSDVVNSRALGQALFQELTADPKFAATLQEIKKAEWTDRSMPSGETNY